MLKGFTRKQKKKLYKIVIAIVLSIIVKFLPGEGWIKLPMYLVPYLVIGWEVLYKAGRNIIHLDFFDEQFLMAVATLGAFAVGDFPEAVAVMVFYQIGELFENIAVGKSRKSISKLMDIRPDYANLVTSEGEKKVDPSEVNPGDEIIIKPGERVPLDGYIVSGNTALNTAALTGESVPVDLKENDEVISGAVNLTGVIRVKVKSSYQQSTVSRILELVENASDKKARIEGFITRFARYYTPIVVVSAVLLAIVPPLILGGGFAEWIHRSLVFLVVSCPCALVVSVPLTFFGGIGAASREGILIKGSNYMEILSNTRTVVFDKTGTLTRGVFEVEAVHSDNRSKDELLRIASIAESMSSHPIAQSIIRAYKGEVDNSKLGQIEEIAGKGIKAVIDGKTYYVGNMALMDIANAKCHECHKLGTVIHIAEGDNYLGHIVINDEIKTNSKATIDFLKKQGIKTVMLTGDKEKVALKISEELGLDECHYELLPQDKVNQVESLLKELSNEEKAKLAFVGDGINDAPVLMRADAGVAMGALGSDAAIEASDIVLMNDDPLGLSRAISISRKTMNIVRENIVFAIAIKVIILILGAFGIANMWIAVFGDVGVLILAILNALRTFIVKH